MRENKKKTTPPNAPYILDVIYADKAVLNTLIKCSTETSATRNDHTCQFVLYVLCLYLVYLNIVIAVHKKSIYTHTHAVRHKPYCDTRTCS